MESEYRGDQDRAETTAIPLNDQTSSGAYFEALRRTTGRAVWLRGPRGMLGPESDIDLLVEMPAGASLLDLAGLGLDLEQALGRKVDILTYSSIHPRLRDRILAELVTLF